MGHRRQVGAAQAGCGDLFRPGQLAGFPGASGPDGAASQPIRPTSSRPTDGSHTMRRRLASLVWPNSIDRCHYDEVMPAIQLYMIPGQPLTVHGPGTGFPCPATGNPSNRLLGPGGRRKPVNRGEARPGQEQPHFLGQFEQGTAPRLRAGQVGGSRDSSEKELLGRRPSRQLRVKATHCGASLWSPE